MVKNQDHSLLRTFPWVKSLMLLLKKKTLYHLHIQIPHLFYLGNAHIIFLWLRGEILFLFFPKNLLCRQRIRNNTNPNSVEKNPCDLAKISMLSLKTNIILQTFLYSPRRTYNLTHPKDTKTKSRREIPLYCEDNKA